MDEDRLVSICTPMHTDLLHPLLDMLKSPDESCQAEACACLAGLVCRGELAVRDLLGVSGAQAALETLSGHINVAVRYPATRILDLADP